jgi:hypothetical protein
MTVHQSEVPIFSNDSVIGNISGHMPFYISVLATSDCSVTATRKHLVSIWRNGAEVIHFSVEKKI